MKRICLVGPDNYLMLNPAADAGPVSGEAVQQVLLARAFRDLGYDVSTVVSAMDTDIDESIDGIRVLSAFRRGDGIPTIRFLHPRATGVFRALSEVNADIYCQAPAGLLTGLTAAFCRSKHRRFIFRVASDVDCIPGKQLIDYWRDRKIFEFGMRRADVIAVQSLRQKELLTRNYGLHSFVVDMAMEVPDEELDGERDIDVLWISNIKQIKRPDRVLALAKRMADVNFTMIGGVISGEEDYYDRIKRGASELPNVRFLGQVPYQEVNQHLARSKVFVNTSDIEGFPNTFPQAWGRKVPIVSFFDPDEIIVKHGFGRRPKNDEDMRVALRELLQDHRLRETIGEKAHKYAANTFSPTSVAQQYVDLFS